jgi:hypothetical protein
MQSHVSQGLHPAMAGGPRERGHSRRKCFSMNPSEKKLLGFELTHPCCKQDFISINLILGMGENE